MPLFALSLAAGIVAATPTTPIPWVEDDDYPSYAFRRGWEGVTVFELAVAADGRALGCTVAQSSGHEVLDERTCKAALRRAAFTPARDGDGTAVPGIFRGQVNWAVDPAKFAQSEAGPDLELSLSEMPDWVEGRVSVKYALMVDATGKPTACSALSGDQAGVLADLGCSRLLSDYRAPAAGNAAIRTAWITFVKG